MRSSDQAIAAISARPASSAAHSQGELEVVGAPAREASTAGNAAADAVTGAATVAVDSGSGASAARAGISAASDIGAVCSAAVARASTNGPAPRATKTSWRGRTPMRIVGAAWPSWLIGP